MSNLFSTLSLLLCGIAMPCVAAPITSAFTGSFSDPNDVLLQIISITAPSTLTIQTWGYGGGVNGDGQNIPSGGFDPVVTLFDPAGDFVNDNDDGQCPPGNALNGNCFDSTLSAFVSSLGTYTVALTVSPNFSSGITLADGFLGIGDFNGMGTTYAMDITVDSVNSVPEPSGLTLLIAGAVFLAVLKPFLRPIKSKRG